MEICCSDVFLVALLIESRKAIFEGNWVSLRNAFV